MSPPYQSGVLNQLHHVPNFAPLKGAAHSRVYEQNQLSHTANASGAGSLRTNCVKNAVATLSRIVACYIQASGSRGTRTLTPLGTGF